MSSPAESIASLRVITFSLHRRIFHFNALYFISGATRADESPEMAGVVKCLATRSEADLISQRYAGMAGLISMFCSPNHQHFVKWHLGRGRL